ncbi:hypothetical protein CQ044_09055, partial [Microbacterium sp. MYb64]
MGQTGARGTSAWGRRTFLGASGLALGALLTSCEATPEPVRPAGALSVEPGPDGILLDYVESRDG